MQRLLRGTLVAGLIITATVLAACTTTATSNSMAAMYGNVSASRWQGDLRSPNSGPPFIGGDIRMEPFGADSALVSVFVVGADTAVAYPWRLHQNDCGAKTGRQIMNYTFKPIKVSGSSDATQPTYGSSSAVIPLRMPTTGIYAVEILAPNTTNLMADDAVIVACGNLLPVVK